MRLPARGLWVHHSVTASSSDPFADFRYIERIGVARFRQLSYSFLIHSSGTIGEGAGDTRGAHTSFRNTTAYGICFVGNYETQSPTAEALSSFVDLAVWLLDSGRLSPNVVPSGGHRDLKATACPGSRLYAELPKLRVGIAANRLPGGPVAYGQRGARVERLQLLLNALELSAGPVDGVYGKRTAKAVERLARIVKLEPTSDYTTELEEAVTGVLRAVGT